MLSIARYPVCGLAARRSASYKAWHHVFFNPKARRMSPPRHGLAIIGAGGHGSVVADAALVTWSHEQIRIFDDAPLTEILPGLVVATSPLSTVECSPNEWRVVVAIGDNTIRQARMGDLKRLGYRGATVIHPAAIVSNHAVVNEGAVIMAGAVVNARAVVGEGCIVNSGAIVEHDVKLGGFTHLSPGAVAAGGARIGHRCWIGASAVVKEGVTIGDDIVLGALGFAHADLQKAGTYVGAPARPIEH